MVFKTIIDNIRSFFQKEDELLKEPKKVPDAASEVLGDPSQPVVEKKLPDSASPKESTPELPFSAQELQNAFRAKQKPVPREPEPTVISPHEIHELESEYVSDDDLMAFEETMQQVHDPTNSLPQKTRPSPQKTPLKDGFFSSFQEFVEEGDFDPAHLDGDLLHKMRVFHQRRLEGKEPLLHKETAADLLRRRLSELQVLEHEWERLYAESRDAERSMIHVEEEIDEKTKALRTLLAESQQLSLLAEEVPPEQAFVLANGVKAYSLGGLLRAVNKDSWLFDRHVSAERNDFADWTRHVLQKKDLADRIDSAGSISEFLALLHS